MPRYTMSQLDSTTFELVEREDETVMVGRTMSRFKFMQWCRTLTDEGTPFNAFISAGNGYTVEFVR